MSDKEERVTPQELGAFGIGLAVTIGSALLTSVSTPILPPFNFLLSFGLGAAAFYGARSVLDPKTSADRNELRAEREYRAMLSEIAGIGERTAEASRNPHVDSGTGEQLGAIARIIQMILERYRTRKRDFAGAAKTLMLLQKFDDIRAHYIKLKRNELFLDPAQAEQVITETEAKAIPMVQNALRGLGNQLDSGEAIEAQITKDTLESMVRSLDFIKSLEDQISS